MSGPLKQLLVDLAGKDSARVEKELNRFNRREVCWVPVSSAFPAKTKRKFCLYRFGKQKIGGKERGPDIEAHLKKTKRIKRALSLESQEAKGWIANPATYPEEFKGEAAVILWGSTRDLVDGRLVAYLLWVVDRVIVLWFWIDDVFGGSYPAVLAN
jgi:hypothetical protein